MDERFDWRKLHTVWLILAALFAIIAFFVIHQTGEGFNTAIVYALSAVIIGEMLYIVEGTKKPNLYAMLVGAILACFPVIVAVSTFDTVAAMWLEGIGIIAVWILNAQDGLGDRIDSAGELALIPMGVWAFWGFIFLYQHIAGTTITLTWQSGIYHLGIMLFAAFATLRFAGAIHSDDKTEKWTVYLLALAVLGMILITNMGQALQMA